MSVLQAVRNAIDTSTGDRQRAQAQLDFLTKCRHRAPRALREGTEAQPAPSPISMSRPSTATRTCPSRPTQRRGMGPSSATSRSTTDRRGRLSRPSSGASASRSSPSGERVARLDGARPTSSSTTGRQPTRGLPRPSSGRQRTRHRSKFGRRSARLASRRSSMRFGGAVGRC